MKDKKKDYCLFSLRKLTLYGNLTKLTKFQSCHNKPVK